MNYTLGERILGNKTVGERILGKGSPAITLLSFDLERNCYIKNVVLFEENSILPLPERLGSSEW